MFFSFCNYIAAFLRECSVQKRPIPKDNFNPFRVFVRFVEVIRVRVSVLGDPTVSHIVVNVILIIRKYTNIVSINKIFEN